MPNVKPFGGKSYGSIPHLPGSRLGPGDHHVHEGQARICLEKPRDRHDLVIVQEKVDGSNVGVGLVGGEIVAITRAGYLASTSPYPQHHQFSDWVMAHKARFRKLLHEGERVCGEWMIQAHGTRYELPHEPFVAFDIIVAEGYRLPFVAFTNRIQSRFVTPALISLGSPCALSLALKAIEKSWHGAIDPVEGAVWRVERDGAVDFLAKYVRPEKADGCYLESETGKPTVWNVEVSR